jgi:hypothetical protein
MIYDRREHVAERTSVKQYKLQKAFIAEAIDPKDNTPGWGWVCTGWFAGPAA